LLEDGLKGALALLGRQVGLSECGQRAAGNGAGKQNAPGESFHGGLLD
jgi:hypothetical protein